MYLIDKTYKSSSKARGFRRMSISVYQKSAKLLGPFNPGRLRISRSIKSFLLSRFIKSTEIEGHKMFLDSNDSLNLLTRKAYEPFKTELVKNELKKGDTVLDIGANIGYYSLIFAKLVGPNGKVFAFEPDPGNFTLLKKNVKTNRYQNVTMEQKAVSNKTEKVKLYLSNDNSDHRTYESTNSHRSVEVEAARLDDYFRNYGEKISFIKMDIQGAEGLALEGMLQLLEKNRDVRIMTEFWCEGLRQSGTNPESFLKILERNGFTLFEISEAEKKLKKANISNLLKILGPEKKSYTNLFCVRGK